MDSLITRQAELYESLKSIQINFSKDSASRKTTEYLEERLSRLNKVWTEFEENNSALSEFVQTASDQPYFKQNIYESALNIYQATRNAIISYKNQPTEGSGPSKLDRGTDPSGHVDELLLTQRTNFRAFHRLLKGIKVEEISEKWELEDELRTIQSRWNNIDNLHLKIDNILQGGDLLYEDEFFKFESAYKRIKRALYHKISSTAHINQATPQLEIPTFNGTYTSWPTFFDLFTETIHNNNSLSKAQKLQHLKVKVKGEAEHLIQHLHISAENYDTAWEILTHRFNNPQILFTKQIETFLNQPNIHKQTSFEIKRLYDTSIETLHAIHNLGIETETWDPLLVHILSKKLDQETYRDYKESRKNPRDLPSLEEFMLFLENKFIALEPIYKKESLSPSNYQLKTSNVQQKPFFKPNYQYGKYQKSSYQAIATHTNKCLVCTHDHDLFRCLKFLNMSPEIKLKTVSRLSLCQNCLYKHYNNKCISLKRCKECGGEHNTLLHEAYVRPQTSSRFTTPPQWMPPAVSISAKSYSEHKPPHNVNHVATHCEEILLTTLLINIKSAEGNFITLRALLDQGSQISLISENAVQLLGLKRHHYSASISGIGNGSKQSKGVVTLECSSIYNDYEFSTQALVITKVINNLPSASFKKQNWHHTQNINLADPEYNLSRPVDLLLDASVYSNIIMNGLIKVSSEAPIAQQTKMGWILSGSVKKAFNCHVVINDLSEISKYWEMEDIHSDSSNSLSNQDQFCEEHYQKTTRRLESGRYEVALPMKPNYQHELGLSKAKALAQFRQLEQKLSKNETLAKPYREFMDEYKRLGHMRKVTLVEENSCFLPHHGVWKLDSETTKLRVVFNASSKTSSNRSLNDLMERGPNLQQDLQSLILSWRQYKYALNADIEKMFRMIFIREADQHLQTILWRNSLDEQIEEYHLTSVTFGVKAAPYLAMRTLRQLAIDDGEKYPLTPEILNNKFYTDDLFYGSNSLNEAKMVRDQLIAILNGAGFNLRKWSSNNPALTQGLATDQLSSATIELKDTDTKALGLRWNPVTDNFTFKNILSNYKETVVLTKRQLLSDISKVFDPIGWLTPLTIKAKLLFQQVWATGLSWDEVLPTEIQVEWSNLKKDLQNIENITIPRHLGNTDCAYELHGFCDASEKAYASAVYIVTINDKGERTSRLVTAKTKLAPLNKQVSLPRLELCGALLLAQLINKVKQSLSNQDVKLYAWTDSMVVLGWLHGDVSRWKQFVANRVLQIINVLPLSQWHHVRSEENAADCASRGISCEKLLQYYLWWEGPKWLIDFNISDVPHYQYQSPELEAKKPSVSAALCYQESIIEQLLQRYNSITRVAKTMAWIFRFINRARGQRNDLSANVLSSTDIDEALNIIIKQVQAESFKTELDNLKSKGKIQLNSNLLSLNPYLDDKGLLRVGGRLANSNINVSAKNPIILPSQARLTELIINQAHIVTLHGGPRLTLNHIRNKYWIISGMRTTKKHLRRCITCRRFNHKNLEQIMGDLPKSRVMPFHPFTHCGVDFTGHVELKASNQDKNDTSHVNILSSSSPIDNKSSDMLSKKRSRRVRTKKYSIFTVLFTLLSLFSSSTQQEMTSSSVCNITALPNGGQTRYFDRVTENNYNTL